MNLNDIKHGKPTGATGWAEYEGKIYYFISTSYGWRQIKGNVIQFLDPCMDEHIKKF
jgi:YHS domain-containing protein